MSPEELEALRACNGVLEIFALRPGVDDRTGCPPFMPRIICRDGAILSVQANKYTYCTPRNNDGPYTAAEVGYPSPKPAEMWDDYRDGPHGDVYGYVPMFLIASYIAAHGGIDPEATFPEGFEWKKM